MIAVGSDVYNPSNLTTEHIPWGNRNSTWQTSSENCLWSTSEFLTHQRINVINFVFTKFGGNVVVQLLSCVRLFATPWTAAHQVSLSFIISLSLLKLMSIVSVIPSSHLIICCPLLFLPSIFPSIRFVCLFAVSWLFAPVGQITGASASAPVLPASPSNQGWFPLGLTGLISLLLK